MFSNVWGSCSGLSSSSDPCFQKPPRKKTFFIASHLVLFSNPRSTVACHVRGASHTTKFHGHPPVARCSHLRKSQIIVGRATLDEKEEGPILVQEEEDEGPDAGETLLPISQEVMESVKVLKSAAKTRKVKAEDVLSALSTIEQSKVDPSRFLKTLGGSQSPGRTWMLIFTAEKKLDRGRYFPITAIQRFDAAGRRIENGVFLGPLGYLTFEGRFSWKKRILAFIFERIRIKVGPFKQLEIGLGQQGDREPNTKDPFFIWFYIDEEIAVARGRSGGTAFWCQCRHVAA
ncbi:hypothetical protein MLD38_024019 [Melastoma candidum]|uniref:Uncharacterized protein n=1 Tax=Melastoma candidum TaxID=119954 RepID=A0ACB9NSB6_9MYRT|nr:hypothetical protein MLD38_024019 [Melastoma candidum]